MFMLLPWVPVMNIIYYTPWDLSQMKMAFRDNWIISCTKANAPGQMRTIERMRTPVRHISYGIRHYPVHTLLSRMYGTITTLIPLYLVFQHFPHWNESSQLQMKLQYARIEPAHSPESLIQNTWIWKKMIGDINVCIIKSKDWPIDMAERTTTLPGFK